MRVRSRSRLQAFSPPGIGPDMPRADLDATLSALFDAERAARIAHDELVDADLAQVVSALERAASKARELEPSDDDEASLRLVRIAGVLGELHGSRVVDLLIDILGSEDAEVRRAAGEALSELAFDRFKEVAVGVERALDRLPEGSPALAELPYLLAEVPEPGVARLLARFLASSDVDAVASAIEAVVERGDLGAIALLDPLEGDMRRVQLEDEGGTEAEATLGELVAEARTLISKRAPA
jgi:hypothetical protein